MVQAGKPEHGFPAYFNLEQDLCPFRRTVGVSRSFLRGLLRGPGPAQLQLFGPGQSLDGLFPAQSAAVIGAHLLVDRHDGAPALVYLAPRPRLWAARRREKWLVMPVYKVPSRHCKI